MHLPGRQTDVARRVAAECGEWAPRWMWLAMPDDVAHVLWIARAMHPGRPAAQRAEARYMLRELARTSWRREIGRPTNRPALCRPSKAAAVTGYRTDSARKQQARAKLSPERRREIAAMGGRSHGA